MNSPDLQAGQWQVTVRTGGEILAASAVEPSIELGLLGIPAGYTPPEITGWLHDLIGVARETGRDDARQRPIPALLHHGLTGLLFSHAQLWNRDGERHPLSYAIVHAPGAIAFGWIGEASITARVAGQPADLRKVIVRDDEGREARAFELADTDAVELRLEWAPEGAPPVVLDAYWPGSAPAPDPDALARDATGPWGAAPPAPIPPADEASMFESALETPERDPVAAEAPSLREAIEPPPAPHLRPEAPVEPMADIERESLHPFAGPDDSFFDPESEPLDLDAAMTGDAPPAGFAAPAAEAHPDMPQAQQPDVQPPSAAPAPHAARADAVAHSGVPAQQVPQAPVAAGEVRASADPQSPGSASQPGFAAEAPAAPDTAVETMSEPEHGAGADAADADPFPDSSEARPSRLRRMFARFAFWRRPDAPDAAAPGDAPFDVEGTETAFDVPGVPDQVPPTPEPAHLTAQAVADDATEAAPLADEEEILIGAETPSAAASLAAEPAVSREPADAAPPSPSPPAVTADERPAATATGAAAEAVAAAPMAAAAAPAHPDARAHEPQALAPAPKAPAAGARPVRTPMRPQWPSADEFKEPAPLWKRPWVWAVLMAALFAGGWIIGHMNDERRAGAARGVRSVLRTIGLGGAHFEVMVNSRPQGAWISVDGEDLARRTPASIELEPGEHEVTLSFSDLGAATFQVRGADGDRLALEPALWGAMQIYSSDQEVPVAVSVDGVPRGFAPLRVDSLAPGAHEVRFSGPGLPSWGQTVQVRVGESAELIARPMTSPATGVIEVRAAMPVESGTVDIEGARVWLDGEPAGQTPLTLELPRGPHSIRVEHLGETAPVQVIDLPGGNQRFATFLLRSGEAFPTLAALDPPAEVPLGEPTVVSMALDGVQTSSVREMWLHVQTPDGPWRRYQMAWLKATGGVVGVAVFPTTLFDADGRTRYYASASTHAGDEYFSEIHVALAAGTKAARAR